MATVLETLAADRRVMHADDERAIGNGVIITLADGWCRGDEPGTHVFGEDTPTAALRTLRLCKRCECAECAAKASPTAPAAPVASGPVPADVPCYLAVSTVEGVDTVMGVFRVADHASPEAAEREASKLCDRIRAAAPLASYGTRWSNGKPTETDAAFAALDAAERALAAEPVTKPVRSAAWSRAFDAREAARERAVSLDPVRFVRTYPTQAYAFRHLLPADMVARIKAAEDDAAMRAAVGAPAMVPQPCQPQQADATALEVDPIATARSYGFKIEPRAVFEADPRLPEGLLERAAAYQGEWVFYDLDDNADGFLLVGSDAESIAADWYSGHGCDYEGAPVMRPARLP